MTNFDQCRAVVVLLAMRGCGACEEYKPRFEVQAQRFIEVANSPFVYFDERVVLQPGQIPILILDAESPDPTIQAFADLHKVHGLPTTILLTRNGVVRHEGSISDREIYDLLATAARS